MAGSETSSADNRQRTERVYDSFFDPDDLAAWVAPDGFNAEVRDIEPEEGGTFRIAMDAETEEMEQYSHTFRGTFQELKPGEKIVWIDESGEGDDHGTSTVSLDAVQDGTDVTLRIAGIPAFVPLDQATERWEDSLDKLANRLEG